MISERIRLVEHKGKQVLVVDLNGLVEAEILPVLVEGAKRIRSYPPESLLTMTDATTVRFTLRNEAGDYDRVAADSIRNCIMGNGPHVKASAISLAKRDSPRVIVEFFNRVSDRHFEIFDSGEEALDWLVSR